MEFYTAFNKKRPIRLKKSTREFAAESLQGKYGDEAMQTQYLNMDFCDGFGLLSDYEKYDAVIKKIAEEAPVRICESELVSGAATLGGAIYHEVPALYNGNVIWRSISHVTLGFNKVLKVGINDIWNEIEERLKDNNLSDRQKTILLSMKNTVHSMRFWHKRYLDATKKSKPIIHRNLLRVPFDTPRNFYEAVQSLWFTFAFTRLCGNWSGIGRIDEMLGGFLKRDLENGTLTIREAREILAGFFIKGCEWIQSNTPTGSGDAQHYQNIVLGGINEDGEEVTNEVTYLVLDIVEELPIGDFPITIRINKKTPLKLKRRAAEVMRHGGGVVAVYNESLIIESMTEFGYSLEEARRFANDGCWEVIVPGKTCFSYYPIDALQVLLNDTLCLNGEPKCFINFESLYDEYKSNLKNSVNDIYKNTVNNNFIKDNEWLPATPCSVVSLFTEDCIQSGKSYLEGGAKYTVVSPHIGGAADVGNSLLAIKNLVFEDKKVTFRQLMQILKNNWEQNEIVRQYALNKYTYYGNDDDIADNFTVSVLDDFADIVSELKGRSPILFPSGVSTFGRQIEWAPFRAAVPFGYKKGEILAGNSSPTPGTDMYGETAVIKSYCKANLKKQSCGAALDIKLYPSTVQGENGVNAIVSLIDGFTDLGGFFMQLDVVDTEVLKKAQQNPKEFKTLSVRVSGWNARFVTLDKEWQNMIIEQSEKGEK